MPLRGERLELNHGRHKAPLSEEHRRLVELILEKYGITRKRSKAFHGLVRVLISNMVKGVSEGFCKELEIVATQEFTRDEIDAIYMGGIQWRAKGVSGSDRDSINKEIKDAANLITKGKYHEHLSKKKEATNELQTMLSAIKDHSEDW